MNTIRILHVINGLGTGGAEAIVMNWYRNIDRSKVQFDFLVRSSENIYEEEIRSYGGMVYVMPPYPKAYFTNRMETEKFFRNHAKEYAAIHVHGNALLYVNVFDIAKKYGINVRIFHSHSTETSPQYKLLHSINRMRIRRLATDYFACSEAAGRWAFQDCPFKVIYNGVMTERFRYNPEARERIRGELGIPPNAVVYGHVGRFVKVKNHAFMLEVFEKILRKQENAVLLFIGDGELHAQIKDLALEKVLNDRVMFLGTKKNVGDYMSAMDIFMLPSYHEGLPIVAVEAQTSGLPSVLSDRITKEVAITDLAHFLPISSSDAWTDFLVNLETGERRDMTEEIRKAGYDIVSTAKWLEAFYCSKN